MSGQQNQYKHRFGQDARQLRSLDATELPCTQRRRLSHHISTVYEGRVFTWSQTYARCGVFASFLADRNIGNGDTVARCCRISPR